MPGIRKQIDDILIKYEHEFKYLKKYKRQKENIFILELILS